MEEYCSAMTQAVGCHASGEALVCWIWISSESPRTYILTMCVLSFHLRKIQLVPYFPKCDYCLRRGGGWGCLCITPEFIECMKTELVP